MMPLPNRWLSSCLLTFATSSDLILIDCGEETQIAQRIYSWDSSASRPYVFRTGTRIMSPGFQRACASPMPSGPEPVHIFNQTNDSHRSRAVRNYPHLPFDLIVRDWPVATGSISSPACRPASWQAITATRRSSPGDSTLPGNGGSTRSPPSSSRFHGVSGADSSAVNQLHSTIARSSPTRCSDRNAGLALGFIADCAPASRTPSVLSGCRSAQFLADRGQSPAPCPSWPSPSRSGRPPGSICRPGPSSPPETRPPAPTSPARWRTHQRQDHVAPLPRHHDLAAGSHDERDPGSRCGGHGGVGRSVKCPSPPIQVTVLGAISQIDAGPLNVGYVDGGPTRARGFAAARLAVRHPKLRRGRPAADRGGPPGDRPVPSRLRYDPLPLRETVRNGEQAALAVDAPRPVMPSGSRTAVVAGFDWGARTRRHRRGALARTAAARLVSVSGYLIGSQAAGR